MHASPEAGLVRAWLRSVARRAAVLVAAYGAAAGLAAAGVLVATGTLGASFSIARALAAGAAAAGVGAGIGLALNRRRNAAAIVERATPSSHNLIVTADELLRNRTSAPEYIAARVLRDAAGLSAHVNIAAALPARRQLAALAGAAAIWLAAIALAARAPAGPAGPSSTTAAAIEHVDVTVVPPEYSRQPPRTLRDPARIEALQGSRIELRVDADAAGVTIDTVTGTQPASGTARKFASTVAADADGYIALTPLAATGSAGVRRLIGLTVTPDRAPRVRVSAPGHDMLLPNGRTSIALALEADDDLGLASLRLRYTRVKGSGENFTFTDGDVPLTIARQSDRAWSARGDWPLTPLDLEPGDLLIYRGSAADKRPGAPAAESDAFILEIASPGAVPGEGFAIDDRLDKYALSQQMVIVKTEKLIAARASMAADDLLREAQGVAAEQRQVRAEFMFMMGGELADAGLDATSLNEEVEAAGEDDLAAGRLANQGRADLLRAIRSMSRAATRLADAALGDALPHEKDALTYLQRAFSRNRYILRVLAERERLDDTRRLTGLLTDLARLSQPAAAAEPAPRTVALRRVLSDLAALTGAEIGADECVKALDRMAGRLLQIDPASSSVREVATTIVEASGRPAALASVANRAAALQPAASALASIIRSSLPADSPRRPDRDLDTLAGALAAALRLESRR